MDEIVAKVYSQTKRDENGHLIYTGKNADIKRVVDIRVENQKIHPAKLLYSHFYNLPFVCVRQMVRLCNVQLCLEPTHYCQKQELHEGEKDANGWTLHMRQQLLFKLGLLPWYDTTACLSRTTSMSKKGYSSIRVGKEQRKAHVISLRLKLGRPLSPNLQASHICNNRACVNPYHLVEETPTENVRRQRPYAPYHNAVVFPKPSKTQMVLTEEMLDMIVERIETSCDRVIDPNNGSIHLIPRNKCDEDGYVRVNIFNVRTSFHVLAAIIATNLLRFPNPKQDEFTLHTCQQKNCCSFEHVKIGSHTENMQQKRKDNTHRNTAKISKEVVNKIRIASGSITEIAKTLNVSYYIVKNIRNNNTWVEEK